MNQVEREFRISIEAVGNGYIVRPLQAINSDCRNLLTEMRVFESFETLTAHLRSLLPIYPVFSGITMTTTAPKRKR